MESAHGTMVLITTDQLLFCILPKKNDFPTVFTFFCFCFQFTTIYFPYNQLCSFVLFFIFYSLPGLLFCNSIKKIFSSSYFSKFLLFFPVYQKWTNFFLCSFFPEHPVEIAR